MNAQDRCGDSEPLSLQNNCIYLAREGAMRPYAKTAEFFRNTNKNPDLVNGRILALHRVSGPDDVHYPTWEMHPEGDELLILASGSLSVEFRGGDKERAAPLAPQAACIVPAGTWHRVVVHEPSVLIAITPRHNTAHQKG